MCEFINESNCKCSGKIKYGNYCCKHKRSHLIQNDFITAYEDVDVIITPTSPFLPFKLGEKVDDPLKMYLSDIFTVPMSLAGIPALNIPFDHSVSGLPIGMQLVGNFFKEDDLFNFSRLNR